MWPNAPSNSTGIDVYGVGSMISNVTTKAITSIHLNTGSVGTTINNVSHVAGPTALLADNSAAITGAVQGIYTRGAAVTTTGSSVTVGGSM